MSTRRRPTNREVTQADMDAAPSEYGGNRGRSRNGRPVDRVEIAGEAATMRSEMVRSDPTDPGRRGRSRRPR